MTKSEIRDCGLVWNSSSSICADDFLKRYERIPKDITIEYKPDGNKIMHETLHTVVDAYGLLLNILKGKIALTKVEIEEYSISEHPKIHVEYYIPIDTTVSGTLEMPKNIGIDVCCIDGNIMYKHDYKEPKKEEPKEETVLQFKEISW